MFSFSRLVLFFYLLISKDSLFVKALLPTSQPSFISIPLTRPTFDNKSISALCTHGSIIQQQHTNRGIRRLSSMTGRIVPSNDELFEKIWQRASLLPNSLQDSTSRRSSAFHTSRHNHSHKRLANSQSSEYKTTLHTAGLSIEGNDIGYLAQMQIGTPPRDFALLVDSGSSDLWVGAVGCRSDSGGDCGNHTFLGSSVSSSFNQSKEDWAIGYVSGAVSGYLVQDVVSIVDLTLNNHRFGVAYNESADFTSDDVPFDGLLGLSKPDISEQHVPTFLQSLVQAELIAAPIASYKIPRLVDGSNNTGEMTLGAMDPKHYYPKSLVTVKNVNKFGFWGVAIDSVKVGKHDMNWSNRTMVMDTGTTLMIAPKNDVDAIHKRIPGAQFDGNGWTVPCNMSTVLSLKVGGEEFTIQPGDVAFYPLQPDSTTCMSGIGIGGVGPFDLDTDWLVGDVFLKNVYFSTNEDTDEVSVSKPRY